MFSLRPIGPFVLAGFFLTCVSGADWYQWRGPQRNGVASGNVKLANEWPKEGPKLIWKNTEVPSGRKGGYGSLAVANGRIFAYVNWTTPEPTEARNLNSRLFRSFARYTAKVPPEVLAKIEQARLSAERTALKGPKKIDAWAKDWAKTNIDAKKRQWQNVAIERLIKGKSALPWDAIQKLLKIRGKEFPNTKALEKWFNENGIPENVKKLVIQRIPKTKDVAKDVIVCLRAQDGKLLWKAEFPGRAHFYPASATPCVIGDRVYALGTNAEAYALDAETGAEIWKTKTKGNAGKNESSSMVIVDGVVILLAGPLQGLDAKTGKSVWTQPRVAGSQNSPAVWAKGNKKYVLINTGRNVSCVDPKDGRVLWNVPGGGMSSATVVGDVMAVYSNRKEVGVSAYSLNLEQPKKLWMIPKTDRAASPVIYKDHVYVVGGRHSPYAMCIELGTGKINWEHNLPQGAEISSPIAADDRILAVVGPSLYMIDTDPAGYRLLAQARLGVERASSPAFVDGLLYLRQVNAIACYDLRK